MSKIRGVIFDVDGTLVDSNDQHAQVWVDTLDEFGYKVRFDQVRRLVGMGSDKLLPKLAGGMSKESPEGKPIVDRRSELFKTRYLPHLRAFPGVKELLALMRGRGLTLVVASSAQKDELKELLKICGADEYIKDFTSSSDADRSKPDPDIVEVALDGLGMRPEEVLMVGDTPYDIEAAAKLGIRTIAFRSGGWSDSGLSGALAVYDGPADLRARFEASPFVVAPARDGAAALP